MKRKPKHHIPQSPEECTPDWFTEILDPPPGLSVSAVRTERIGEGIGFVGDLFRCSLTWSSDAETMPQSVVVKVPSSVPDNRAVGEAIQAYEREILVYRDLRDQLQISMPDYIYSDLDPHPVPRLLDAIEWLLEKLPIRGVSWLVNRLLNLPDMAQRRYLLVIEDIDDARPAAQFDGGSLEDALSALVLLAQFHACNWMNKAVVDSTPLVWSISRTPKVYQALYRQNRHEFVERFGGIIGTDLIGRLDAVQEQIPEMLDALASEPWTILHGDYRLDNILFRSGGELVVLDYQLLTRGRAGWDVAYFITTALEPEHRSEEDRLLRAYHEELVRCGVANYSFAELVDDAKSSKLLLAHRVMGTGDVLRTEVEGRDESLIELLIRRVAGWVDT